MTVKIIQPNAAHSFYRDAIHGWATWDNAFSKEECEWIIGYSKAYETHVAEVFMQENKVKTNIRESNLRWLNPTNEFNWVYDRLSAVVIQLNQDNFRFDLFGFIEGLQFTEYNAPSGHYGKHIDIIHGGPIRKLSLTMQLTDPSEYEGGNLELHYGGEPAVMEKKQGSIVIFPSSALHQVTPVTKGTRHSIVGWITGRPFK